MRVVFSVLLSLQFLTSCHRMDVRALSASNTARQIIGGEAASTQAFPFIVNIWQNSPRENFVNHLCGGSLVAKKWVLTAAHCVLNDVTDKKLGTVPASELRLFVGSDHLSGQGGRELKVRSIAVHPDFSWPQNDLALIELQDEVTDITPVQLNEHKDLGGDHKSSQQQATVAGWGLMDERGTLEGSLLQQVQVPLISRAECGKDWFVKKRGWAISADMLCASSTMDSRSACPGDSGGPLFMTQNKRYVQIGVVSWGNACRGAGSPQHSDIQVYADIAEALPWIQRLIQAP